MKIVTSANKLFQRNIPSYDRRTDRQMDIFPRQCPRIRRA